jgi:hypothetical protein
MKLRIGFSTIAVLMLVLVTGCTKDDDANKRPEVTSTNPINKATDVAMNRKISATFNAVMNSASVTYFKLQQGTTTVLGTPEYADSTIAFTPTVNLLPNTVYTATIAAGASNISGTSMAKDYVWSFTTGAITDVVLPTVTLTNPANNTADVALNQIVTVSFSEPMDHTTINASTFTLKQESTTIGGTVSYTGTTATFKPASNLAPNKNYTATITTGVKDLSGNALATTYIVGFSTKDALDNVIPVIVSTAPINTATGIARNQMVAITFNEAMNPFTINATTFTLKQGTRAVAGVVAYSGTTAEFTPSDNLMANTEYTATITTGAKDLAGNALADNTVWKFTTGGNAASLAVVNIRTAANYAILAKTAINNNPTSVITGDLGLSPAATSYLTGFALTNATGYATSVQVTGKVYAADMAVPTGTALTAAVEDMLTAYTDAAGRPTPDFLELGTGNIGGKTLTPGLYKWTSTVTIPNNITISGNATDVWIFQISGNLITGTGVNITLSGGALAKNIFWQVAGQATIWTNSHFEGVILSKTGITFQKGASLNGRALAQTAVVLDGNTIVSPN